MSADKLQAVHETLAEVFNEPNLNAVGIDVSHDTFNQKALSEAFSESRLNATTTEHSIARFDHGALIGIFDEALPTSHTERQPTTNFDRAFAEVLSEHSPLSSNTQSPRPNFDQQALAEMLSKPAPASTNTRPSQPSFDHQALAEMLAESRADPIDHQVLRPSHETDSPAPPFPDRIGSLANPDTVASSANAENARPPRARSLLTRLHHIFATKDESLRTDGETKSLQPRLAGQAHTPEPTAIEISIPAESALPINSLPGEISPPGFEQALQSLHFSDNSGHARPPINAALATASTDVASALLRQATPWPNDSSTLISSNTESSPPKFESKPSIPTAAARRISNANPEARTVAAATSTAAEDTLPQQANSSRVETVSPTGDSIELSASIIRREHSAPHIMAPATSTAAPAPLANAESARQRLRRLLAEVAPKLSADPKPTRLTPENEPSGEPDHFGPAVEPVAAPSAVHAVAAQQTESLSLAEIPTLISTNTITSCSIHERSSQPTLLSGRLDSAEPSEKSVQAAPNDAASSLPQHVSSLLAALHVLNSKPSPPPLEEKSSRLALASQRDEAAMSVETIADPPDAESAFSQSPKSLMPEMPALVSIDTKSSAPIFEEGRGRPLFSDRAPNEEATATAVASSADMESAVTRVQQAKSLLDQLDLNTAIQLRWTMRDIKSKRTKFAPVSADDLKALVNLGFVEMRDGLPRLTTVGLIALD